MTKGHGDKSHLQPEAIAALLSSPSIPAAAAKVGVAEKTLDRWLKEPAFQQQYRAARREVVEQGVAVLQRAMTAAVATLLTLLKREDQPAVQCRAAALILEQAMAGVSLLDHETRITEVEALLAELKTDPSVWEAA